MSAGTDRKLRMAMIGGGGDGFIGPVHRRAAALCGNIDLVAGAFSSDPQRSRECGRVLALDPDRVYDSFEQMIAVEASLPDDVRPDFVSIVTPNHLHYRPSRLALESGFHVLCDKPVTRTLEEARSLQAIVASTGRLFGLTHTYLGYPLVTQARRMAMRGDFGVIRKVFVEYLQGWLTDRKECNGSKQAAWRTDPEFSGAGGAIADIGTHAHNLVEYVCGQRITHLAADLSSFVEGRMLDDDASALIRTDGGAKGTLSVSQVCAGMENGLRIAVFGTQGGFEWAQQEPNTLTVRWHGKPDEVYRAGCDVPYLDDDVRAAFITPSGHPEGYLEAFAALYRSFAVRVAASMTGAATQDSLPDCPSIDDGVRGMEFVSAMIESSVNDGQWTPVGTAEPGGPSAATGATNQPSQVMETT